ncbi:LOG family protein [Rhizobium sp. LjRoot254]|uniref:LOG family protein n=1 Tax=Rhizobium sp. LjRoot254 TaxID=3342297 RepID=UPI003ECF6987
MAKGKTDSLRRKDGAWAPLESNRADKKRAARVPSTPQTRSSSYKLAFADLDFLSSEELRPLRLQLELMKVEMALSDRDIRSTVVLFGGARIPAPGQEAWAARNEVQKRNLEAASIYYDEARQFARLCAQWSAEFDHREYVVVTGGGPGVMEAGNRGADDEGAPSIGFNIVLPHEQAPNAYVTPDLAFNFHYFAIRKMHFMMRAKAVAVFPGGFGTLDEFFEAVTLIQTGRMARIPVLMFGAEFWRKVINFEALAEFGTIAPEDVELIRFVDTAEEAFDIVKAYYAEEEA